MDARRMARGGAGLVALAGCLGAGLAAPTVQPAQQPVVVAARDIAAGASIGADDVTVAHHEARFLAPGVFASPQALIGKRAHERILAGDPIRAERLEALPGEGTVAASLRPGARAITVQLDDPVLEWIGPGMWVDLLVDAGRRDYSGEPRQTTVAREVQVLAVSQATSGAPGAVTVSVSAEHAARIALAERQGPLRLSLANGPAPAGRAILCGLGDLLTVRDGVVVP